MSGDFSPIFFMKKGSNKPNKRKQVLAGHKRQGKKFIPPFSQQITLKEVHWANRILPEIIWLAVLNSRLGIQQGSDIGSQLAKLSHQILESKPSPVFWFISSFDALSNEQKAALTEKLEEKGILEELQIGLQPFFALYPDSPLNFLSPTITYPVTPEIIDEFKQILDEHFYRREQPAMIMQAHVIYFMAVCKTLSYTNKVTPPDLESIITSFASEASQKACASVGARSGYV